MNTYTIEFTTFVIRANSKEEAVKMIKQYITKQSKDLDGFLKQKAIVTEKDVLTSKNDIRSSNVIRE